MITVSPRKCGVRSIHSVTFGLVIAMAMSVIGLSPQSVEAQYIKLDTPFQANTESFYQRIGIDFGFRLPGSQNNSGSRIVGLNPDGSFTSDGSLRFTQNGVSSAIPPFGGYDPNNDGHFGWNVINPNGGGYSLGIFGGQGNTRTSTATTPTIVVPNGIPGSVSDQQFRPFVTGFTPVVGGFPGGNVYNVMYSPGPPISPLQLKLQMLEQDIQSGRAYWEDGRLVMQGDQADGLTLGGESQANVAPVESTATQSDLSVAEIRRQQEQAVTQEQNQNQAEIDEWVADAESLIEQRKYGAARICLRTAIRLASGEQRQELQQLYESLQQ